MRNFLTCLVGLFVLLIVFIVLGSLFVPPLSAEKRWAADHAMCEWKAGILHTTPEIYEATREFNIFRYVTCMVELGQSTQGPRTSSLSR